MNIGNGAFQFAKSDGKARKSASPAAVAETLRVVRLRSLTPMRVSNCRIDWLSAGGDTRSLAAARTKLPSSTIAEDALSTVNSDPRSVYPWINKPIR